MVAGHARLEEGGIDWRRLAAERNVSHVVARGLWEHARATAPDDPVLAERAFLRMLEDAEAANATHEPGRETLVDAAPGARDASSLGPGKWTRVLLEEPKPRTPAGAARRGTETAAQAPAERGAETGKQASAEELRKKLVAAGQASKHAAALLAASDPATILEALRELRDGEGPGVLQKIMSVAGGAIERILGQRSQDPAAQAGPVGERVQFSVGDEVHTQYVDDDGVPMMASTPKPVTAKVEEWRAHAAGQSPAVQQRVAPELARATSLGATATDQAKKAKTGDPAAKAARPGTQQALGGSLATISRQIGAEPAKRPPAPPATAPAPAPAPVHGVPDSAAANRTPAATTPAPATPPAIATSAAKGPDPAAANKPDPAAVKVADDLLHKAFHLCGGKLPHALAALSDQERIDQSARPAADLRHQHYPTFDGLKAVMSPGALEKATQLDHEVGLDKGAEGLPDRFKGEVLAAFHADTYATTASFEALFNEVAKHGYMMKGKPLTAADFNAAVPAEHSLARVINTDGAFSRFLKADVAERDWSHDHPGETAPSADELTAYVLQKAKADASGTVTKYVLPTIVEFPSWLFPEPDIKADAVFSQYCDLLALYANWYPQGHLRMVVKRAAVTDKITRGGLRKPTVFDGTLSPLWLSRDNRDHNWGKTGGGLREALMKVDWNDIDHGKWVLAAIDPKYQAVLDAQRAKNAHKATAADAKVIADHEKSKVAQTETAQAAQRAEDGNARTEARTEATEKAAAEPVVVPTTMAGAAHTLKADPTLGKVAFNSIAGWAVEKLQSVVDLVPDEVKSKATRALAKATEATAIVVDPALKPGGKPADRPVVAQRLAEHLKELAIAIRIFGDSGKLTDADPAVVQQVRVDEEMRLRRMARARPAGPAHAPADLAPGSASTVVEPAPGSPAAQAKAGAASAAAVAPQQGGLQSNDLGNGKKGRTPEQTAAVATADPRFGGATDAQGRATETVAQAAERLHPGERDSNFNPKVKVEFEAALAREILASPGLYAAQVYEISGKILAYVDAKARAGIKDALTQLAALKTSPTWFGHVAEVANATEDQIGEGIRQALRGRGNIPQHLAVHQVFLDRVLDKDWDTAVCQAFVGDAVHPTFVREQTRVAHGELNPDGAPVFDKPHASERGRVQRPNAPTPIGAAAGPVPRNADGSDPAPLIPDGKTHEGTSAGTAQTIDRGTDLFTMDEAKAFVQRARLKVNMPLIAGISGSTAELINCAMTLGLTGESLHRYALGVIGYIGGGGNHSFIEIVTVLAAAGLPVNPDTYEGFYPAAFAAQFHALKERYPQAFHDAPAATTPGAPERGPS
ncbi:MAG TPA: hypothetical protein VFT22_18695 [Kofleriaceae bacterium]|nr:hypothetical protein [Kofleriaceae bacterium]